MINAALAIERMRNPKMMEMEAIVTDWEINGATTKRNGKPVFTLMVTKLCRFGRYINYTAYSGIMPIYKGFTMDRESVTFHRSPPPIFSNNGYVEPMPFSEHY